MALRTFLAGFGLAKFAENFFLARGQFGRRFDVDLHDQIAMPTTLQDGHTRTALAQLLARLDAFGDGDGVSLAIKTRNFNLAAERSGRKADRCAAE